jgi:L-rhamnose-H+ transport protein
MSNLAKGLSLVFAAAVCGGAFALPMKFMRRFKWENTWLWASFTTMIAIPLILGNLILPAPASSIMSAGSKALVLALVFGFGWGVGTITFGIGVNLIGLSLGYAIIMGVNTAVGSLLPMIVLSPGDMFSYAGGVILAGIGLCMVGVIVCGYSGILKERGTILRADPSAASEDGRQRAIIKGMIICVISGVLSAFINLGFSFARGIAWSAQEHGASPSVAGLATWMALFCGSFPAVLLYCGGIQVRRETWRNNMGTGAFHDFAAILVMGVLWFGAIFLYGVGAYWLGRLGTSVGWAFNISASLLVANTLGFATGEWKAASKVSVTWLLSGLAILICSMIIMGHGNSLLSKP